MARSSEIVFDKLVYSCAFEKHRGDEEFIPGHFLGFQMSGETHAFYEDGNIIITENQIVLVKKNQLIRTVKHPGKSGKYQFISITLDGETLRQYAIENKITIGKRNNSRQKLFLEADEFLRAYFLSLSPYINKEKNVTSKLADLKSGKLLNLFYKAILI